MVDAVRGAHRRVSRRRIGARKLLNWTAIVTIILPSVTQSGTAAAQSVTDSPEGQSSVVRVDATPGHAINSFDPDSALRQLDRCSVPRRHRQGLHAAHHPGVFVRGMGDQSPIATTANFAWPPGIGLRTEPGATRPTRADTSPAARNSRSRCVTFFPMRCRTAAFRPAATAPSWVRTSATGRAIRI